MESESRKHASIHLNKLDAIVADLEAQKTELQEYIDQLTTLNAKLAPDGTMLTVNANAAKISCKPSYELVGHKLWDSHCWEESDKTKIQQAIKDASSGRSVRFELTQTEVPGGLLITDFILKPVFNDEGQVDYLVAEGRDVTDRKLMEEELIESKQRLQEVLDTIPARVFWKDKNLRYMGCNKAFARDAGLSSPDDIIGKDDLEMPWAEQAESYRADDRRVVQTGEPKLHYEEEQTTHDGHLIWVITSKIPFRDASGHIIGIMGTYEDITKRKLAEQKLIEEKQLSEMIINALPGLFFMINRQGKEVWWNEYENRMFDHDYDEDGYFDSLADIVKEDQDLAIKAMQKVFIEGSTTVELRIRHKDGKIHDYLCTGVRVIVGGEPYIVGTGIDITERKQSEDEKRAFYRETVKNVTQGKLELVTTSEAERRTASAEIIAEISNPEGMHEIRQQLAHYLKSKGLKGDVLALFLTGVGEAMTNAIKHAQEGCVYAGKEGNCLWVAISDKGPGIETLSLPGATLLKGFSTKISMGMGYTIMLDVSDKVLLSTGHGGTTVVLERCARKPEHALSLDDLPDVWGAME